MRVPVKAGAAGLAAVMVLATPLVARWEGKRNDPYLDVGGVLTVCYGETANVERRRYSDAECSAMLNASLAKHAEGVLACIPETTPTPTKAAFASFGYNVGIRAACGSTAAKRLRAGDVAGACHGLAAWVLVKGKRVQGLVNRRNDEMTLCLKGAPLLRDADGRTYLNAYGEPVK